MQRTDSFEKTLMLEKIEGRRIRGRQRMRQLDGITNSEDMSLSNSGSWWWTGKPGVLQSMGLQRVRHNWGAELNWTDIAMTNKKFYNKLEDFWFKSILTWPCQRSNFWIWHCQEIPRISSLRLALYPLSLQYLCPRSSNTLPNRCEEPVHWKRPWCWERLRPGWERGNREWDVWMTSLTQWTWVWANAKRLWRTGKLGVLQSMELQRVRHDSATEQHLASDSHSPFEYKHWWICSIFKSLEFSNCGGYRQGHCPCNCMSAWEHSI